MSKAKVIDKKENKGGRVKSTFLLNKKVTIRPVENGSAYIDLLVDKSNSDSMAFLFDGMTKNYGSPIDSKSGNIKPIFDNDIKWKTDKFDDEVTEQEFFERLLDSNFSPYHADSILVGDARTEIDLTNGNVTLDLSDPWEYVQWKVALANEKVIARSFEERHDSVSFMFCIVDQSEVKSKEKRGFKLKAQAYAKYAELSRDESSLAAYIKSLGTKKLPASYDMEYLETIVGRDLEDNPELFLDTVNHKYFEMKVMIYDAVDKGAMLKRGDKYSLDTGLDLGDVHMTIAYLGNPDNQDVKLRLKGIIDNN
jgi:hypothetical protein